MSQTEVQLIKDAVIVNADVSNSAAIDVSKISGAMPLAGGSFTDDVTFTGASANIVFDKSDNALEFADSAKATFGADADLQITHNNNNSFITDTGTGQLMIQASGLRLRNYPEGHTNVNCQDDVVELYYDNSKKFETTSGGVEVTGNIIPDANNTRNIGNGTTNFNAIWASTRFRGNDNVSLQLGNSVDFKILHDGTTNLIESPTGSDLHIKMMGNTNDVADQVSAKFIEDGAVELYFNGTKKFETSADGAAVSNISNNKGLDLNGVGNNTCIRFMSTGSSPGHAYRINYHSVTNNIFNSPCISFDKTDSSGTFDSHIGAISDDGFHLADNKKLHLGGSGATGDLQIFHDGSNSRISDNGTGNLILDGNEVVVQSNDNSETQARFITNGAVELYHNNVKSARTINTGSNGFLVGDDAHINASINHGELIVRKDLGSPNNPTISQCARITVITNEQTAGGNGYGGALFFGGQDVDASNQYTVDLAAVGATTNGSDIGNASASGFLDFYTRNGGAFGHKFRIDNVGDLFGTDQSIAVLSDSRLKENIEDFTYDINKFKQFKPKTFNWKYPEQHRDTPASGKHRGFIAQDLEVIDSELVKTYRIPKDNPESALVDQVTLEENELKDVVSEGKTANLGRIDAMYISVINQLIAKVETLETKVAALEAA